MYPISLLTEIDGSFASEFKDSFTSVINKTML